MSISSVTQFREYIAENLLVPSDELPAGRTAAWFTNPSTGGPTMFEVGKPVPFDEYSGVIAIYQSDQVIRVYSLPLASPSPRPADWKERQPTRYTLTRDAPTFVAETMSWDTMAKAVTDEGNRLIGGSEAELIMDYIETKPILINRDDLIKELTDGAHLEMPEVEEDEEEGEDEEQEEAEVIAPPDHKPMPVSAPAPRPTKTDGETT